MVHKKTNKDRVTFVLSIMVLESSNLQQEAATEDTYQLVLKLGEKSIHSKTRKISDTWTHHNQKKIKIRVLYS